MIRLLLIALLFYSCSSNYRIENKPETQVDYMASLQVVDSISFPLDSVTSYIFTASDFSEEMGVYSFLFNRKLLLYDYNTSKLLKKIPISEGNPSSYVIHNTDSIILMDYSRNSFLFMNEKGTIYKRIKLLPDIKYYPSPVSKTAPILLKNNMIYYWGNISGEYIDETVKNRKVQGTFNLETNETTCNVPYSEVYHNRNWGGGLYRWVYTDYDSLNGGFVVSFPADNYVYRVSESGEILSRHYAGSQYVDYMTSLDKNKLSPLSSEEKISFFVENHSYSNVLYDAYRKIFYRIAELRMPYDGKMGWQKDVSIVILDDSLNVIGETFIGKCNLNYRYSMFVNERGLHIPQRTSEDRLTFKIYQPCGN